MDFLFSADALVALITLTFLEIVLGIDNVIFISIVTGKLPQDQRKKATRVGLFLAMFLRIALLLGISVLIKLKDPLISEIGGGLALILTDKPLSYWQGASSCSTSLLAKFTLR